MKSIGRIARKAEDVLTDTTNGFYEFLLAVYSDPASSADRLEQTKHYMRDFEKYLEQIYTASAIREVEKVAVATSSLNKDESSEENL